MKRRVGAVLTCAMVALAAVLSAPASAQTPPTVSGDIPAAGGVALLSAAAPAAPAALIETLSNAGCVPEMLAVTEGGSWRVMLKGAPAFVSAQFPASIQGAFYVSCLADAGDFWLTLLHHNDGESQLIDAGSDREDFGGVARFATLADALRTEAVVGLPGRSAAVLLSAGDNFLAGPEFNASLDRGVPFYDAVAMDAIDYDVLAIGNHEFDFGPDVFAEFIESFSGGDERFVSANLDFSREPRLQALAAAGRIAPSVVIEKGGRQIGIVGATTPRLPFISTPRAVGVDADVAGAVQVEIDALQAQGVDIIILVSHLQGLNEDRALIPELRGVDIAVAGGGDELLANASSLLIPGDEESVQGAYPLLIADADGREVPVVTGPGDYTYLGRLIVRFDAAGNVTAIDDGSGPVRVSGTGADAVVADAAITATVVQPVEAFVADLAETVVGTSAVPLDGQRSPGIRTQETNLGNLVADALLWQAQQLAVEFSVTAPVVAIQNGGGIRNNNVIPPGDISELTTFNVSPFGNFVTVVPGVAPPLFKALLENAVAGVKNAGGAFPQIAGFTLVYDPDATPRTYDAEGNVTAEGSRVVSITLDSGTQIVANGSVLAGAPNVSLATLDFLARGGDQYPYGDTPFTRLNATDQQAVRNYIRDALNGQITVAQYPEGGEGRITTQ